MSSATKSSRIPPPSNRSATASGSDPRRLLQLWRRAEFLEAKIAECPKGGQKRAILMRNLARARDALREWEAGPAKYWLDRAENGLRAPEEIADALAK